jgi:hypothetical protein
MNTTIPNYNNTLIGLQYHLVLNYQRIASKGDISRLQIDFLVLCINLQLKTFSAPCLKSFGFSHQLASQYFKLLTRSGYFIKISPGKYQFSVKGYSFTTMFIVNFFKRISLPFSWR